MNLEQNHTVTCPYCGEEMGIVVDCTLSAQEFVEDCQVCCQPIQFTIRVDEDGNVTIDAEREDG